MAFLDAIERLYVVTACHDPSLANVYSARPRKLPSSALLPAAESGSSRALTAVERACGYSVTKFGVFW